MKQTELWQNDTYSVGSQGIQQNYIIPSGLLVLINETIVWGEV
jgi:hypothetical protein